MHTHIYNLSTLLVALRAGQNQGTNTEQGPFATCVCCSGELPLLRMLPRQVSDQKLTACWHRIKELS